MVTRASHSRTAAPPRTSTRRQRKMSSDQTSPALSASTPPSSPPSREATLPALKEDSQTKAESPPAIGEEALAREEEKARLHNDAAAERRRKALLKKKPRKNMSAAEREQKKRELDDLLKKTAVFGDILTKKTQVLGKVGVGMDGKTLGEHDLTMAKQPDNMIGGTMRDYQLEGLTWMYEICSQGMSGILADEMGLGKTIQVIALIALLREQENYLGPHLIIAPLSTLSNWVAEFKKWCPSVPVLLYHGTPTERTQLRNTLLKPNIKNGRPTDKFPVVCTSYELILRDRAHLIGINWEFIIIDEGHRMKNADARLFQELRTFTSATRLLITGTPLQNNLKELWALLHFLLPNIFTSWEAFETWFDFSDLEDEDRTDEFIEDEAKQDLVKKIHVILQPLLLRRLKADVAVNLPKKREYVLYAPMSKEQTDLYNAITNKDVDTRSFLENKALERITSQANTPAASRNGSPHSRAGSVASRKSATTKTEKPNGNVFSLMLGQPRERGRSVKKEEAAPAAASPAPSTTSTRKRKSQGPLPDSPPLKSAKSSRQSTPAASLRTTGRKSKRRPYKVDESDDDDALSDDEFEAKIANEYAEGDEEDVSLEPPQSAEEIELAASLDAAKKQIATKKLGNEIMQLRLVCNSPHHFYNPWEADPDLPIDESIVTASGKMLLLDRLLPALFERGHKVLIFSQFALQLDILEDYLRELRGWNVCRIDGSVAQQDRADQIESFNNDDEFKIFLLSTRAGGQGINLATADTVILFDSDWNPQQDLQAQDRAHRIGQKRPVVVFRLATKGTVEEELLLSADAKRRLEKLVIKKGGFTSMGQKMDPKEQLDKETLRKLLLKDGQVYKVSGDSEILSNHDLDILCDRSDEAYAKAASGSANADGYKVIDTGVNGITMA